MLDNDIKKFIEKDYPVLLEALGTQDLEKFKACFSHLSHQYTTWQKLEQKLSSHFKGQIFSFIMLIECIFTDSKNIFQYLVKEQEMSLIDRQVSLLAVAMLHGKDEMIDLLLEGLEEAELLNAAKLAEQADREEILHKILLSIHQKRGAKEIFSLEDYEREIYFIPVLDMEGRPANYLSTAENEKEVLKLYRENARTCLDKINQELNTCQNLLLLELGKELVDIAEKIISNFERYNLQSHFYSSYLNDIVEKIKSIPQETLEQHAKIVKMLFSLHQKFSIEALMDLDMDVVEDAKSQMIQEEEVQGLYRVFTEDCEKLSQLIEEGNLPALKDFFLNWQQRDISCFKLDKDLRVLFADSPSFSMMLAMHAISFWRKEIFEFLIFDVKLNLPKTRKEFFYHAIARNQEEAALYLLEKISIQSVDQSVLFLSEAKQRNHTQVVNAIKQLLALQFKQDEAAIKRIESRAQRAAMQIEVVHNTHMHKIIEGIVKLKEQVSIMKKALSKNSVYAESLQDTLFFANLLDSFTHTFTNNLDRSKKLLEPSIKDHIQYLFIPYILDGKLRKLIEAKPEIKYDEYYKIMLALGKIIILYLKIFDFTANEMPAELETEMLRRFNEDAVDQLTNEELGLCEEVKKRYSEKFKALGQEEILDNLRGYLEEKIKQQGLSLIYSSDLTEEELKQYYASMYHTAWRYLFCHPNPWQSKSPRFANGEAIVVSEDMTMLAYFWLAACDRTASSTNSITFEERKEHFVREFSLWGRAHNLRRQNKKDPKSPLIDDQDGDKPSCPVGLPKRNCQLLFGHPILDEIKPLSPDVILTRFREALIASNQNKNSLFDKLQAYSALQLQELKAAIQEWAAMLEDSSDSSKQKINAIKINPEKFIQECNLLYGEKRLQCEVIYQNRRISNYVKFIEIVASNPVGYFANLILEKIDQLIISKQSLWKKLIHGLFSFAKKLLEHFITRESVSSQGQTSKFLERLSVHLGLAQSAEELQETSASSLEVIFTKDSKEKDVAANSEGQALLPKLIRKP